MRISSDVLRQSCSSEENQQNAVQKNFSIAVTQANELKKLFLSPPRDEKDFERIKHEYRLFAQWYNAGNIAAAWFREPDKDKKFPERFVDLAEVIISPRKVGKNKMKAWNYIHAFLAEQDISGIYQKREIPPTTKNIVHVTTGLIQALMIDSELPNSTLHIINQELRWLYHVLGGDLRGLKKGKKNEFLQLKDRIKKQLKEKSGEYDEEKVLEYVHRIIGIME